MDKKKQIEEMARDICNMCRDMYGVCDNKEELCPAIKAEMEYLYNAGYRKESETAEKFAKKVKEIKIRLDLIGNPYEKKYTQADLKEVANGVLNQFLRYIDEICKEFTEGSDGK
jgi:hypothetical protein